MKRVFKFLLMVAMPLVAVASEDAALDEFDLTLRALTFKPPRNEDERIFVRQQEKAAAVRFLSHTKLSALNSWYDLARTIRDDAIREESDEAEALLAAQAATATAAPTTSPAPTTDQQVSKSSHDAIWDEIERLRKAEVQQK
jgi:hypothetical protein